MILIGAVALAFIVLGVVVVFNGVLYTETLSSADTGQTASSADATELEVRQGVACLAANTEGDYSAGDGELSSEVTSLETGLENDIETYAAVYRNATAHSQPATVDVRESEFDLTNDNGTVTVVDTVTVTLTYDSSESSYERTVEIRPEECPEDYENGSSGSDGSGDGSGSDGSGDGSGSDGSGDGSGSDGSGDGDTDGSDGPSIEQFSVSPESSTADEYTVEWEVTSTDLEGITVVLSDEKKDNRNEIQPEQASGQGTLYANPSSDVTQITITAEYSSEETVEDSWEP